jgi:hypothetical protein
VTSAATARRVKTAERETRVQIFFSMLIRRMPVGDRLPHLALHKGFVTEIYFPTSTGLDA